MSVLKCRSVAILLLVLHLGACTTWRPATVSPREVIEEQQPSQVRITLWSDERLVLQQPETRADSIVGEEKVDVVATSLPNARTRNMLVAESQLRSVALADVREVEVGRTNVIGPVLVAPLALGIVLIAVLGVTGWGESLAF